MARGVLGLGRLFGAGVSLAVLAWAAGCGGAGDSAGGGSYSGLSSGGKAGASGKSGAAGASGKAGAAGASGKAGAAGGSGKGGSINVGGEGGAGGSSAGAGAGGSAGSQAGQGGSKAGSGGASGVSGASGAGGSKAGSGGTASGGSGGAAGTGGSGAGAGPSGGSGGSSGSPGGVGGSGGSSPPNCAGPSNIDNDGDGYSEEDGDCNDCDPNANPGAVDVISVDAAGNPLPNDQQADEDCDGTPALPGQDFCDANLDYGDGDPIHGAFAMDICKVQQGNSWGIISAEYIQIDGNPLPDGNGPLGHGILPQFGAGTAPKHGQRMFGVSSGAARAEGQPDFQSPSGFNKNYTSNDPPGFPLESPACGGAVTGQPHDSVALRVKLKVPTNAKSFSFKFRFFTFEYPVYICSQYNDFFTVLMDPPPADVDQVNKNITFDSQKNPVSVNNAFLEVCTPSNAGGKDFPCPGGTADLEGTGFQGHGGTLWLQTQASVTPGSVITLTFGAFDSGDGVLDSTGIVDDFRWSAEPAKGGTSTGKP